MDRTDINHENRINRDMKTSMEIDSCWSLHMADGTEDTETIPAVVPGDLYSDLLRAGMIDDPYFRDNELEALRLSDKDYIYETSFDADADILSRDRIRLVFEGLDTLAEIRLNGVLLGTADNMHRTWKFDIKDILKAEDNYLSILFRSPTRYIRSRYEEKPLEGTEDAMRGFPYLRKAHCMFGWDWGPRLPGCGIFRPVRITGYDTAAIESVYVRQEHADGSVTLRFEPEIEYAEAGDADISCEAEVFSPDGELVASGDAPEGLVISDPHLWYPAGYGPQPLYTVRVTLMSDGKMLDTWERRIGLRTMTVTRRKDEYGESFAHTVNGIEVFAMGADYIPEDSLTGRTSPERTRRLLEDARLANHNCIRVWGGGYYPEDWFYDICDELGLIVWQDFMFACAAYDLSEEFEANIRAEIEDNVRRLRHHASLGLWCGNNEMEQFADEGQWVNTPELREFYLRMYEEIFPEILEKTDPQTFYWPASPSSGGGFDEPNSENMGDVHYWDVWHGNKPFTEYRKFHFRYLSEFGFQSFPAMKTIESFTEPEDRNIYSYVMEKHQRNAAANGKIASYMSQTYLYPSSFDMTVYASQLLQAQAIRYGVEHFRRHRGRCMGTVVWQLNDCWPVSSWSSIDYYGRWKALHYYEKRFFAPLLLSCEEEGILTQDTNPNAEPYEVKKSVRFNVSNETPDEHTVDVIWQTRDSCGSIRDERKETVTVPALSAVWLEREDMPEADLYDDHVSYRLEENGEVVSAGSVIFCQPKYYHFRDPELSFRTDGDEIIIRASAYARDVEILNDNEDLVLSDNYFDMEPGEKRIKILRGRPDGLRLRSTYDIR